MSNCPPHLERVFISGEDGLLARELITHLRDIEGCKILNDQFIGRNWKNPIGWGAEVNVLGNTEIALLKALDPTTIIHAAALVNTDKCESFPDEAFHSNVETAYRLAAVRPEGCYFVHFSTTAIYDPQALRPLKETSPIKPYTIYGQTKWWGEQIATALVPASRLLVLRPCFVYGGARDTSSTVARLVKQSLTGIPHEIESTLDPNKLKDFLWVGDFGDIVMSLIEQKHKGIYNIARGKPQPFSDLLQVLSDEGLKFQIRFQPEKDYLGDHEVDTFKTLDASDIEAVVDLGTGVRTMIFEMRRRIEDGR